MLKRNIQERAINELTLLSTQMMKLQPNKWISRMSRPLRSVSGCSLTCRSQSDAWLVWHLTYGYLPRQKALPLTGHGYTTSVYNQPLTPVQPPTLSGMGNEYWPRGSGSRSAAGKVTVGHASPDCGKSTCGINSRKREMSNPLSKDYGTIYHFIHSCQ